MAGGQIRITTNVVGGHQFRDLAQRLRGKANGELRKAMYRNIRAAGKPVVREVQAAALALPDKSTAKRRDGESARKLIARATRLQVRANGVRIVVDRSRLPKDMRALPHLYERRQGWRHPTWADSDRPRSEWHWVNQRGRPWFNPTVRRSEDKFRRAVIDAMDETAATLERG